MRARSISLFLFLCLGPGCGPSRLVDAAQAVGEPCTAPAGGTISTASTDDIRFWFSDEGGVVMRSGGGVTTIGGDCSTGSGIAADGGLSFSIPEGTLGDHALDAAETRISSTV